MTARWVRFEHRGQRGFGRLHGDLNQVCAGDMFGPCEPTDAVLPLSSARLLMPVAPGKVLALWNNFHALGDKLGLAAPAEPLYFIKAPNACIGPEQAIRQPDCDGKVVYEGERGIVIGKTCRAVPPEQTHEHIFGYIGANDVTLADILHRDPSFPQWVRAKGFDTFCPLGPVIATGLAPETLRVRTLLDGVLRQDYPISDMRFPAEQLVSLISRDTTLFPGDVILYGTSLGVGSMKPGSRVEVEIAGFKAPVLADIRAEIWLKLWGNLSFNPISSLAHATLVDICQYPLSRELAAGMMQEARAVANKLGIEFRVTLDKRIVGAEKVGKHKTSMLQDVEAGRAPEIDALVGAVVELARLTGTDTDTPRIDTVYSLVKLLSRSMAEHGGQVRLSVPAAA